nr:wnt inhibitory factor 1 isoform X2 [Crassostrea gigas]|eukprot:XP_011418865.1 PREDICTED: wnt inhibitory factor 1 isoform X2 [Crassostrea gigas]
MCKAKLQVAGILAMLLYHMFFIIVILPSSISRSRTRLSLWIDERQIASFFGYPLEVFIISDGSVAPYLLDPNVEESIPVIPPEVETVNLTWEAGPDIFTYWFDDLQSMDESLLYRPLLSIPSSGVIPGGPKIFQMSIPCTGRDTGIAGLELGLQIFNKNGRPIRGSPMKLKLKKQCNAIVASDLCNFDCLNGGRCGQYGFCECAQGFLGPRCEKFTDEFSPFTAMCDPACENNGTCMSPEVCICPDGFSGKRCERALCKSPCQHGGRCIQEDVCWCTSGYLGNACQYSKCKPNCQNGGTCIGVNKCRCPVGYQGNLCQQRRSRRRKGIKTGYGGKKKKKKKNKRKKKKKNKKKKNKKNKNLSDKKTKNPKNKKARTRLKLKRKKTLLAEITRFARRKRRRQERQRKRAQLKKENAKRKRKPFVR